MRAVIMFASALVAALTADAIAAPKGETGSDERKAYCQEEYDKCIEARYAECAKSEDTRLDNKDWDYCFKEKKQECQAGKNYCLAYNKTTSSGSNTDGGAISIPTENSTIGGPTSCPPNQRRIAVRDRELNVWRYECRPQYSSSERTQSHQANSAGLDADAQNNEKTCSDKAMPLAPRGKTPSNREIENKRRRGYGWRPAEYVCKDGKWVLSKGRWVRIRDDRN